MKKALSVLLSILMIVTTLTALPLSAHAQTLSGKCGPSVDYALDTQTGKLTLSGTGSMYNYTASDTPWNNYKATIKTAEIQKGITQIGENSFNGCTNLSTVSFTDGLKIIGASAFVGCSSLQQALLPDSVRLIHTSAFMNCSSMTQVTLPASGFNTIDNFTFKNCRSLTAVTIPANVQCIGAMAFENCSGLRRIDMSCGTKIVDDCAFSGCTGLAQEGVYYYGTKDQWNKTIIRDGNEDLQNAPKDFGIAGSCGDELMFAYNYTTKVLMIYGNGDMQDFDNIDRTPWSLFDEYVKTVRIAGTVTKIGNHAFEGFTALSEVLYAGTEDDWNAVLIGNDNDPLLTLKPQTSVRTGMCGDNVTYNFNTVTGVVTIRGKGAMYDGSLTYSSPFSSRDNIKTVVIEEGVTSVGDMMFFQTTVENVTLPSTLTRIGESAFYECQKLENPAIPAKVTTIGQSAFMGCAGITEIALPGGLTTLESAVFSDCYALESIEIPGSVTEIKTAAFSGCSALQSVSLWYSVAHIARSAFYDCSALNDVYYFGTNAQWGQMTVDAGNELFENADRHYQTNSGQCGVNVFYNFDEDSGALVIYGSGDMYDYNTDNRKSPFFYSDDITSVTIENGVTSVGAYAFYGCDRMETLTLADSVGSVNEYGVHGCYNLLTVNIGKGLTVVDKFAFQGCSKLETVNYVGTNAEWNAVTIYEYNDPLIVEKPQLLSGQCGTHATFTLDTATGLLTIKGTGTIYNTGMNTTRIRELVRNIVIEEGITGIFQYTFQYMEMLENITFPNSINEIYDYALSNNNDDYTVTTKCTAKTVLDYFADSTHQVIITHNPTGKYEVENRKEAECMKPGSYELNMYCKDCGKVAESLKRTIAAKGHDYITTTTKATLTKDGEIVKECRRCEHVASRTVILHPVVKLSKTSFTYNGKNQCPGAVVTDTTGHRIDKDGNYTVSYPKAVDVGSYYVKVTFKGSRYVGSKNMLFTINPQGTKLNSVKSKKSKHLTVTWYKQATQTTGYQIQIATDSKFTKNTQAYTITKTSTRAKTIKELKGKTKYYVRIRTYKEKGGTKYYSSWSAAKSATTKK